MRLSGVVLHAFHTLLYPAIILTTLLYLYPVHQNCAFPTPYDNSNAGTSTVAPFRLLALGDPQLEGDTSLPDPSAPRLPSLQGLRWRVVSAPLDTVPSILGPALRTLVKQDIPRLFQSYRKRLDLLGNDFYLAHIYWLTRWWTKPTHVVVLGDLLGSQWISDAEFGRRADRFWNRVFAGAERVPDAITGLGQQEHEKTVEILGEDEDWGKRLINVAGNHDIGYAGDIDERRMERFERAFGPANWDMTLQLPVDDLPSLHIVILNSMNLDKPVWNHILHNETRAFLDAQIASASQLRSQDAVVLLTHIPLHKEAGICVDGPFFSYFRPDQGAGIREQNHLSEESSENILKELYAENKGIVLNGHDHEGCDTFHSRPTSSDPDTDTDSDPNQVMTKRWTTARYSNTSAAPHVDGVRELTVRSMMGAYGGNAGLLSAWFDTNAREWKFEYATCVLGVQHIWWAVHIIDVVVVVLGLFAVIFRSSDVIARKGRLDVDEGKKDR